MIDRKKKLRIIQFSLLIFSLIIIYLTYYNKEDSNTDIVETEQIKETLKDEDDKDLFFNRMSHSSPAINPFSRYFFAMSENISIK